MIGTSIESSDPSVLPNEQDGPRNVKVVFRDGVLEQYGSVIFREIRNNDLMEYALAIRSKAIREAKALHELDIALGLVPNADEDTSDLSEREKQLRANRLAYLHNSIGNKAFQECLRDLYVGYSIRLATLRVKRSRQNHESKVMANKLAIMTREITRRREYLRRCLRGPSNVPRQLRNVRSPQQAQVQSLRQVSRAISECDLDSVRPEEQGQASALTYGPFAGHASGINHQVCIENTLEGLEGQTTSAVISDSSQSSHCTNERIAVSDDSANAGHTNPRKDMQTQGAQGRVVPASRALSFERGTQTNGTPSHARYVRSQQAYTARARQASYILPAPIHRPQPVITSAPRAGYPISPAGKTVRGGPESATTHSYQTLSTSTKQGHTNVADCADHASSALPNRAELCRMLAALAPTSSGQGQTIYQGQNRVSEALGVESQSRIPTQGSGARAGHLAFGALYDPAEDPDLSALLSSNMGDVVSAFEGEEDQDDLMASF